MALPPPSAQGTPVTVMATGHAPSTLLSASVCFPSHGAPMQSHIQTPAMQQ